MARSPLPTRYLGAGIGRLGRSGRNNRHPAHRFYVRTSPWAIQPVAIAPVLPGDTLRAATIQARVATDPVGSKLLGWFTELHLFYIKHRDIDAFNGNTYFQDLVLSPATTHATASTVTGGATATYRLHGRRDFTLECLKVVTDYYFRDQEDNWNDFVDALNGLPLAKYGVSDWTNSLMRNADYIAADFPVDLDASGVIKASEIEQSLEIWQVLQENNLTNMTYEDFLATYGVHTPTPAINRPELLRSVRKWSYPTNTVTQGTGAVSSAAVWSIAERVDKDRFFREPGFLLLTSVTKPKVYRSRQPGAAVNLLDNAYLWLPAVLRDDPTTSLTVMDTISGALPSVGNNAMTVDTRDLFVYGDQFLAASPTVSGGDSVAAGASWAASAGQGAKFGAFPAVTTSTGRPDYPLGTLAERQALFIGQTAETSLIEIEGVISFTIASTVVDQSVGTPIRA